jgi:alkylglycerol monooxygenase
MVILLLSLSYMFGNISPIGSPGIFIYGGFIFLFVYALTELMDRNPNAWIWEIAKAVYGIAIIYNTGDWFGISKHFFAANYLLIAYFLLSAMMTLYLLHGSRKFAAGR